MKQQHENLVKDVIKRLAAHQITIEKDEGEYRSIRFSAPNTVINSFTLTTWPGYIAISGDLGTYVFCRLPDMFEFFRQGAHGDPMT
ncbi:hypothetical protein, partial [Thioalkalivibrio sp. ALE23]|uniref:hypothetical protein n=1 Tax=Thioalkalivibrio sp. ALE23 TaxID=1265495 RepID=UPI000475A231